MHRAHKPDLLGNGKGQRAESGLIYDTLGSHVFPHILIRVRGVRYST